MNVARSVLTIARRQRVFFAHQSVGSSILCEVPEIFARAGLDAPVIRQTTQPPRVTGGFIAHTLIGANGDPFGKTAAFDSLMRGGMADEVDVAMLKYCFVDVDAGSDVDALFASYVRCFAELERDYPDLTFLHATAPLTTTEMGLKMKIRTLLRVGRVGVGPVADNVARERYNVLIRDCYRDTGRLFDIALLESTTPSGERARVARQGPPCYALHAGYASDAGHLNEEGSRMAAERLLELIAERAPRS